MSVVRLKIHVNCGKCKDTITHLEQEGQFKGFDIGSSIPSLDKVSHSISEAVITEDNRAAVTENNVFCPECSEETFHLLCRSCEGLNGKYNGPYDELMNGAYRDIEDGSLRDRMLTHNRKKHGIHDEDENACDRCGTAMYKASLTPHIKTEDRDIHE